MNRRVGWVAVGAVIAMGVLTGCSGQTGGPVIAPVTMSVDDLQGATVDLEIGQVLNITTGDLDGESYSGEVADPAVAEFVPASKDGSADFNPGVKALAAGETEVTLSNSDGGIQDVRFTVSVSD
ncbi:hypothetical protein ACFQ0P_09790 [Microbacterium insulae]|uniref:Uncharacterized protein n=1 Tax=Microbacterium insulae TaxID=483014 RepID=A0ABW3AIF8_9MICO